MSDFLRRGRVGHFGTKREAGLFFLLQIFAEDDCFGDFLHGLLPLPASSLRSQTGVFFTELQIALQNSFGALDDFSGFEAFQELRVVASDPRSLDLGASEES